MDSITIKLCIDATGFEDVLVEPVAANTYRLEETPIFANRDEDPIYAGDIIEVQPLPDATHRLICVVERSPMRHASFFVPQFFVESVELWHFGSAVEAAGGRWESALGGFLWVHLPADSGFDSEAELSRRIAAAKSDAAEA
jgi:hypothetical protein